MRFLRELPFTDATRFTESRCHDVNRAWRHARRFITFALGIFAATILGMIAARFLL